MIVSKASRSWGAEARLKFIEFRLYWEGRINRGDLIDHFGISIPQASLDLRAYAELAPENFEYNKQRKAYFVTSTFKPVMISPCAKDYLGQLELQQTEQESPFSHSSFVGTSPRYDIAQMPQRIVDADILRFILKSIRDKKSIEVKYQSMSKLEPSWRWIAPHALASDGFRWHFRAYCFDRNRFSDFIFGRILAVGEEKDSEIDSDNDLDWHNLVELEIGPNFALPIEQQKVIELDYGMDNGKSTLVIRKALLYYVKKHLGLNQSHSENGIAPSDHHICLLREKEKLSYSTYSIDSQSS